MKGKSVNEEITDLYERVKVLEQQDNGETFKALGQSVFCGTANLQEELVLLKMQLENQEVKLSRLKNKLNEVIQYVKNTTE